MVTNQKKKTKKKIIHCSLIIGRALDKWLNKRNYLGNPEGNHLTIFRYPYNSSAISLSLPLFSFKHPIEQTTWASSDFNTKLIGFLFATKQLRMVLRNTWAGQKPLTLQQLSWLQICKKSAGHIGGIQRFSSSGTKTRPHLKGFHCSSPLFKCEAMGEFVTF